MVYRLYHELYNSMASTSLYLTVIFVRVYMAINVLLEDIETRCE